MTERRILLLLVLAAILLGIVAGWWLLASWPSRRASRPRRGHERARASDWRVLDRLVDGVDRELGVRVARILRGVGHIAVASTATEPAQPLDDPGPWPSSPPLDVSPGLAGPR